MDSKIILGRVLQKLVDEKFAQVEGYNRFGFIELKNSSVIVSREKGKDTPIQFSIIVKGIEAYKEKPELYEQRPVALRAVGITHVTSPVFALLHLLKQSDY